LLIVGSAGAFSSSRLKISKMTSLMEEIRHFCVTDDTYYSHEVIALVLWALPFLFLYFVCALSLIVFIGHKYFRSGMSKEEYERFEMNYQERKETWSKINGYLPPFLRITLDD